MSLKATNIKTQYVTYEPHYYYCDVCGRKSYREGAVSGTTCNSYNSAPAKYPQQHCKGTMISSTYTGGQPMSSVYERETS